MTTAMAAEAAARGPAAPSGAPAAPLRLLFIVENDQPHASAGGYYALFKFAERLARLGHQVSLYAAHDLEWIGTAPNLRTRYRPGLPRRGRLLSKLDRWLSRLGARWILESELRSLRPDWILGVLTHSAIKAEALGRRHGIPVANFVYECPPWMEEELGPERFRLGYDAFARDLWERTRAAYLRSRVLFPNSGLSRHYNSIWLGGKPVAEPIHPGVDPERMPIAPGPEGEPVALDPARKHVLYVGRISEGKNIPVLIAAYRKLRHAAELHLCGTGPDLARMRELAAGTPGIRFHGFVPDDALWSLFRQCHVVAYPTSFEGFGMPPMQALYFGKPCVASDLPVFRSVFGDRLEYFPPGDAGALAAAIDAQLGDPGRSRARGEAGRAYVLGNFTWDHAARRIERTLKETTHAYHPRYGR